MGVGVSSHQAMELSPQAFCLYNPESPTSLSPTWHTREIGSRVSPFLGCGDRVSYRVHS